MAKQEKEPIAYITVSGYEKWGEIGVRARTVADSMLKIPARTEALLGTNVESAKNRAYYAASIVAIAEHAIVSPPDLVQKVMASSDPKDVTFFYQFNEEYAKLNEDFIKHVKQKKSGETTGGESVSSLEIDEDSSQMTLDG
jgi:hypothetical protein